VAVAVLLAAAAVVAAGTPGLAALVLVPLAALYGVMVFRAAGWRLDDGRVVFRGQRLTRTTAVADARRLPVVTARASAFQRRARLRSVTVGVSSGRRAGVVDLDREVADGLVARLAALARG
jgi:uncharacterized membrane protein YdbT with pleckstrin-like domain